MGACQPSLHAPLPFCLLTTEHLIYTVFIMNAASFNPNNELEQLALYALYQFVAEWARPLATSRIIGFGEDPAPPRPHDSNVKHDSTPHVHDGNVENDSTPHVHDGNVENDSTPHAHDGNVKHDSTIATHDGDSDELFLHPHVLAYLRANSIAFTATPILELMRAEAHRRWQPALADRLTPSSVGRVLTRLRLPRTRTMRARRFSLTLPHLARLLALYPAALPPDLARDRLARALQALSHLPPQT